MAKATRSTKTVTKQVMKTVDEVVNDGINLHLTDEEALILYEIIGRYILGPDSGPRGKMNNICHVLNPIFGNCERKVNCSTSLYIT